MVKRICVLLIVVLFVVVMEPFALADWNVQDLTDEELMDYRRAITEELASRRKAEIDTSENERLIDIFPDEGFASIIRDQIGLITINDPVTQEQLDSVTSIRHGSGSDPIQIKSLQGISRLRSLKSIYITRMDLEELPEEIGTLSNLKSLEIMNCKLKALPDSVCDLTSLEELSVSYNKDLSALPDNIGFLENLKTLDITSTSIADLPESIYALNLEHFYREG